MRPAQIKWDSTCRRYSTPFADGWISAKKGRMWCHPPLTSLPKTERVDLRLHSGSRSARGGAARSLRNAEIAGSGRLGHLVDDQFESRVASPGVEEDRFVDRAILLLEGLVVGEHVDGELIFLLVGVLQLD